MLPQHVEQEARERAIRVLSAHGIALTPYEQQTLEVADFGLDRLDELGLELVVYVNTDRCCAKELVLFPRQTCPQHYHPSVDGRPGKEETFRCRAGIVYLYLPGDPSQEPHGHVPDDKRHTFTVWNERVLHPGEQYTIPPNTPHWFQAGPEGAIVSEFSTTSTDEFDVFQDPDIVRKPERVS